MVLDKRLLWTGLAVTLVSVTAVLLTRVQPPPDNQLSMEQIPGVEVQRPAPQTVPDQPTADYNYLLKEYQGHIAVFSPHNTEPEMVLDMLVKYLPDYDQAMMREGIMVDDYDQLVALIEDYIS